MKKTIIQFALCCTLLLASSCATILTGSKQKVTFKSNVPGTVYQNLAEIGKTNEAIKIRRRDITKLYTIKAEGCPDKKIELPAQFNPIFFVNILFGVFVTGYFDLVLGNNYKTEKVINVTMECNSKK
ncbi:MAG: hypothetical protein JNJ41_02520 [Bacteroidia bacterium]|nr:hypothetical protein [Bacteroidia bacterium]